MGTDFSKLYGLVPREFSCEYARPAAGVKGCPIETQSRIDDVRMKLFQQYRSGHRDTINGHRDIINGHRDIINGHRDIDIASDFKLARPINTETATVGDPDLCEEPFFRLLKQTSSNDTQVKQMIAKLLNSEQRNSIEALLPVKLASKPAVLPVQKNLEFWHHRTGIHGNEFKTDGYGLVDLNHLLRVPAFRPSRLDRNSANNPTPHLDCNSANNTPAVFVRNSGESSDIKSLLIHDSWLMRENQIRQFTVSYAQKLELLRGNDQTLAQEIQQISQLGEEFWSFVSTHQLRDYVEMIMSRDPGLVFDEHKRHYLDAIADNTADKISSVQKTAADKNSSGQKTAADKIGTAAPAKEKESKSNTTPGATKATLNYPLIWIGNWFGVKIARGDYTVGFFTEIPNDACIDIYIAPELWFPDFIDYDNGVAANRAYLYSPAIRKKADQGMMDMKQHLWSLICHSNDDNHGDSDYKRPDADAFTLRSFQKRVRWYTVYLHFLSYVPNYQNLLKVLQGCLYYSHTHGCTIKRNIFPPGSPVGDLSLMNGTGQLGLMGAAGQEDQEFKHRMSAFKRRGISASALVALPA